MSYKVIGKFRADSFRICVRHDKITFIPEDEELTPFWNHFPRVPEDQQPAYDGLFSTYEVAVCILAAASSLLKLVDLSVEEYQDG